LCIADIFPEDRHESLNPSAAVNAHDITGYAAAALFPSYNNVVL